MDDLLIALRKELAKKADENTLKSSQRFFKEEIKAYGVKMPVTVNIAKSFFKQIRTLPKDTLFDLCTKLWQSGYLEESMVACNWAYAVRKHYEAADFAVFEQWISTYVTNWASCDTLCNHPVGTLLEMYPGCIGQLKEFVNSENRWMKRAAAVSLIVPARKGLFLDDIIDIADALLTDKDDLVQKGYGWMLKVASGAYPTEVFDYIMRNKSRMPRTALRYAIEKMPQELREKAMEK